MASILDIMNKAFYEVLIDGEKLIDKDYMMGIFNVITKKLPQIQEYLNFMFEKKKASSWDPAKERTSFFHAIYCNLNFLSYSQRYYRY